MDDDTARRPMVAAAASASAWSQPHMSSMMAAFRQHGRAQGVHEERNTRCTLGRTSLHEHFSWLHTTSALVHQHAQTEVLEQEHRRRGSMVVRTLLILIAPSTSAALSSLPEKHILNSRPSSMLALRREGRSRPARCRLDMEETQWAYRQHGESEQRTSTEKKKNEAKKTDRPEKENRHKEVNKDSESKEKKRRHHHHRRPVHDRRSASTLPTGHHGSLPQRLPPREKPLNTSGAVAVGASTPAPIPPWGDGRNGGGATHPAAISGIG